MKGKKILKALGIAALVAAVVPYRIEKDEEKDELTVQSLLWKVTNCPHPDLEDKRTTSLSIGFHSPVCGEDCCCDDCFYEDDFVCCEPDCGCEESPAEEPCCCDCGCSCEESPADETPAE